MYGYIYKTTNKLNNRIYVSQHHVINDQFDVRYYGSGTYIRSAINKYGIDNFSCELLEWCETRELLNERELFWIQELHSSVEEGNYNISTKPYPEVNWKNNNYFKEYNSIRDYKELSEHNKGSKMMTNGIEQHWFYKDEINEMLNKGWQFGSCKKRNVNDKVPWNKGKHGVQKNCKSVPGYIRVTNGTVNTTIKPELLDDYLARGYRRGVTRH